jgi:VWFA-related protein
VDSQSWLARFGTYQNKVEESDALVYTVQFDTMAPSPASQYLKGLSENSGGRLFLASTIPSLAGAFAEIGDELQHQYTICYYPSNPRNDSAFRKIQVTVDKPGTKIRARTGYRISGRSPKPD